MSTTAVEMQAPEIVPRRPDYFPYLHSGQHPPDTAAALAVVALTTKMANAAARIIDNFDFIGSLQFD